jgi:alginate O-acetyltransferase complex protein AlgI
VPGYVPTTAAVLWAVLGGLALLGTYGFLLQRLARRWGRPLAWLVAVAVVWFAHRQLDGEGAGFRMLALVALLAAAMKAVVAVEARRGGRPALAPLGWSAFVAGWLGMQPRWFERRRLGARTKPVLALLLRSVGWMVAGVLTWWLLRALYRELGEPAWRWLATFAVVAFSMTMHFGVMGAHAALLRACGFQVDPQFKAPWLAQNLREFWALRWNLAFSTLTQLAVHRPLSRVVGDGGATAAGFLFSGLLHEVACSLPVMAGFGWPTAYFALHAVAVAAEDLLARRGVRVGGAWGRAWTFAWLLAPLPLLFHEPFARGVLLPLLQA